MAEATNVHHEAGSRHLLAHVLRLLSFARLRMKAQVGRGVAVTGHVWLHGGGQVVLGDGVVLDAASAPIELHVERDGRLEIGRGTYVGGGTSIEVERHVSIGENCRLVAYAKILDNNFHQMTGDRHGRPESVPVVIEDEAQVGARAILLPGARVGRGATVSSGTVLTRRLPAGATAAGVPASVRSPSVAPAPTKEQS